MRGPVNTTRSESPPSRAWLRSRSTKPGSRSSVPTQSQRQDRSETVARASSNTSCPLRGVTAATQSSSAPSTVPGARFGSVHTGLRDVHQVRPQRVAVEQPAPGPRAGRDDRGSGRQHRAFPGAGGGIVTRRRVAQRHVHEHDQAQPPRLGHQHLRDSRGDKTVQQYEGAVGDRSHHVAEDPARRPVGPGPGAGHGSLMHRPSARDQPVADPAVVGVAAARQRWVVDAVRHDDGQFLHIRLYVDSRLCVHSGRS